MTPLPSLLRSPLVLFTALLSPPAEAHPFRRVPCPEQGVVFVPRNCSREFERSTREIYGSLSARVRGVDYAVTVGDRSVPLAEALDQLNQEMQTHYIAACLAVSQTPCDAERRARMDAVTERLPELYTELRRAVAQPSEVDEIWRELEELKKGAIPCTSEAPPPTPYEWLNGTWSVNSTLMRSTCPANAGVPIESTWKVTAHEGGRVDVRVLNVSGQEQSTYPVLQGQLDGQSLELSGADTGGIGLTSFKLHVEEGRFQGRRAIIARGCSYEYEVSGQQ